MGIIIFFRYFKRYFDSLWYFVMNILSEVIFFFFFLGCIVVEVLGFRVDVILRFIRGGFRIFVDDFYKGFF